MFCIKEREMKFLDKKKKIGCIASIELKRKQ